VIVELPAWLVALLVLTAGARGVLRDAVEHNGLLGLLKGNTLPRGQETEHDDSERP
jgi:hypothetical protein